VTVPALSRRTALIAVIVAIAAISTFSGSGCTPLPPSSRSCETGSSDSPSSSSSPVTSASARPRSSKGVYHTVQKGETVWRISQTYGVSIAEIVEANHLDDYAIGIGQRLLIPGAASVKSVAPAPSREAIDKELAANPNAKLAWPLSGRRRSSVTSGFGNRTDPVYKTTEFHKGIDIDAAREERVLAAAGGEVVFAGKMSGFGTVVMLDHGGRLITVYAHLSRAIVKLEDVVERGKPVGYVGTSGKTTGSHLHFEVRYKGVSVDPLKYLP
jgi:murein DD-endopeptidase MepM/ murein hydrolase activator NlpD